MTETMPTELTAGRVVLRRTREDDAAALAEAVKDSLDHLRPWLPWATADAASLAAQRERCRQAHQRWRDDKEYIYVAWLSDGAVAGCYGVHRRVGPGGVDIGYWTHVAHTGKGYATGAVRALTPHALRLPGVERVEVHCDETNTSSAAIPKRLGFRLERVEHRDPSAPGESGRLMIWVTP